MSEIDKTPYIHTKFYVLGNFSGFRKWQNSISGSDETDISLHSLVELIDNSTNEKEQKKSDKSMPSKKSPKVSFVTSGTQKKVEDFCFFSHFLLKKVWWFV